MSAPLISKDDLTTVRGQIDYYQKKAAAMRNRIPHAKRPGEADELERRAVTLDRRRLSFKRVLHALEECMKGAAT